jgi:hypothetical protein
MVRREDLLHDKARKGSLCSFSKKLKLFMCDAALCYLYESLCTLFTARPEGSIMFLNDASQAIASGVLHATDGTEGTHDAAESDGKCSVKIDR